MVSKQESLPEEAFPVKNKYSWPQSQLTARAPMVYRRLSLAAGV
jgi:hypothetical protein